MTVGSGAQVVPSGTGVITATNVPVSGGAAPTTSGQIAYDSTSNTYKAGVNGSTSTLSSVIGGGTLIGQTGLPTTGPQDYFTGMFESGFSTTETVVQTSMPRAGTLSNFFVKLEGTPGGTGFVYTVDKNGGATSITCTVAAAGTTCSDTTHSVSFVQGDLISVHANKNGGNTTAQAAHWTAQLQWAKWTQDRWGVGDA
jgi:hypothetical protein